VALAAAQRVVERLVDPPGIDDMFNPETRLHRIKRAFRSPPVGGCHRQPALAIDRTDNALDPPRVERVEVGQLGLVERAMTDRGEDHARQPDVARELVGTIDLGRQIEPRERDLRLGLARDSFLAVGRGSQRRGIGGQFRGGIGGQLGEAEALVAMQDEALRRIAFLPAHVPATRRRLRQHCPRRCARQTAGLFVGGKRSAVGGGVEPRTFGIAAREQRILAPCQTRRKRHPQGRPLRRQRHICICPADRRGFDRDLAPIRPQFHGNHLRQQCGHTLPHLQLRHGDGDDSTA